MRSVLLVVVLGLLVGAGLMALIEHDPGFVLVSYGNTTIETSLWLALVIAAVIWWFAATCLRLLRNALALRGSLADWLGGRKTRNAAVLTNRGVISYIEGNWARSRRQLLRAARYSRAPLLNYLMAARASFRLGDTESMQRFLGEAEKVESDARIAMELTQAELQLNAGHDEQALATLVRARDNASRHPYVLELLATAYTRLEDWPAMQGLLPELRKASVLTDEQLADLEITTWIGLIKASSLLVEDPVSAMGKVWAKIPKALTGQKPELARCYAECLIAREGWEKAERFIISTLDRQWDSDLVSYLGAFPSGRPERALKATKRWLEQHGRDTNLLLAASRLAMQMGNADAARGWLEEAYDIAPTPVICLERARLCEEFGETKLARRLTKEAAELAIGPLPVAVRDQQPLSLTSAAPAS